MCACFELIKVTIYVVKKQVLNVGFKIFEYFLIILIQPYYSTTVGETIIGALKMQYNYGAIQLLFFFKLL